MFSSATLQSPATRAQRKRAFSQTHNDARSMGILGQSDVYKVTHWKQYPPKTQYIYSYFEPRAGATFPYTVMCGLQAILERELEGVRVTPAQAERFAKRMSNVLSDPSVINYAGLDHLVKDHGGRWPVRINAVAEGTHVPESNVMMTVENTCAKCYWATNYVESLLTHLWYPCTVASQSAAMHRIIANFLEETGGDPAQADYMLVDFGYRGATGPEAAGMGGLAHLLFFRTTDNMAAIEFADAYYPNPDGEGVDVMSVPASEHSTITTWLEANEPAAYKNMLTQYSGPVSIVSDSYNLDHALDIYGTELKDLILSRQGPTIIRPDSGKPEEVVLRVFKKLDEYFGTTTNAKGFKVLNPKIRVLQGDGVNLESMQSILQTLKDAGYSTEALVLGSGGALLQKHDRDKQRFAFKCSSSVIDGLERDVQKKPKTDPTKASKPGRHKLVREGAQLRTRRQSEPGEDLLVPVFENGEILRRYSIDEVRERAAARFSE